MKEQLAALYELQQLDIRIDEIRAALSDMAETKVAKQQLGLAKAKADAAHKALTQLELELKDSELRLKTIDDKRNKCEKRMYDGSISSPKEMAAVEKEIAGLKAQQSELDGSVLELYDKVEAAREQAKAADEMTPKYEQRLNTISAKESAEHAQMEKELADLESQRVAILPKITDKALMSRYEAIRKKTGSTGIARIMAGKCEGCHVAVTGFTIRNLFAGKTIELCENCGRILHLDVDTL